MAFGLRTASSDKVVARLPARARSRTAAASALGEAWDRREVFAEALASGASVVRIGPTGDRLGICFAAARHAVERTDTGPTGAGCWCSHRPTAQSEEAARRLRAAGYPGRVASGGMGDRASGDCVVVGTMSAAYAPLERLCAAVVLDAHDEAYHAEAAPTWCAWEVVAERARRDGAPLALVSPCPTLDVLQRAGSWSPIAIPSAGHGPGSRSSTAVRDDPRTGLFSERVVSSSGGRQRTSPAGRLRGAWCACSTRRVAPGFSRAGPAGRSRVASDARRPCRSCSPDSKWRPERRTKHCRAGGAASSGLTSARSADRLVCSCSDRGQPRPRGARGSVRHGRCRGVGEGPSGAPRGWKG